MEQQLCEPKLALRRLKSHSSFIHPFLEGLPEPGSAIQHASDGCHLVRSPDNLVWDGPLSQPYGDSIQHLRPDEGGSTKGNLILTDVEASQSVAQ